MKSWRNDSYSSWLSSGNVLCKQKASSPGSVVGVASPPPWHCSVSRAHTAVPGLPPAAPTAAPGPPIPSLHHRWSSFHVVTHPVPSALGAQIQWRETNISAFWVYNVIVMVEKQETANTQVSKTCRLHIVGGERSQNGGGWAD